jgi:hypothetical protein
MKKLQCDIIMNSNARHLQPLLAGFNILKRNGIIEASQYFPGDLYKFRGKRYKVETLDRHEAHIDIVINESLIIHYDLSDSRLINEKSLAMCDIYFKRSYCQEYLEMRKMESTEFKSSSVLPLGLYFLALDNEIDLLSMQRNLKFDRPKAKIKAVLKQLDRYNNLTYTPFLRLFEQAPKKSTTPKILFFAKVWNPDFDKEFELTAGDRADRLEINEMRVNCIDGLNNKFGDRFTGGIESTEFSLDYCNKLVIKDKSITNRSNYIKLMQDHDVCIATSGLHNSIGGKFTEYIASSKAIVSENFKYSIPGDINEGRNYFEFSSVDGCLNSVEELMNNHVLRYKMMADNYEYYHHSVRPDILVKNSLLIAMKLL